MNSARPRFDWDDPTLCPLKMRAVIDRLAEGRHEKQHEQLRDCIRGIRPHVGHLYRNLDVAFNKIRCPLKLRCPWCLRPESVLARRGGDFERVRIASELLGAKAANEKNVRVWLFDWPSDGRAGNRGKDFPAVGGGERPRAPLPGHEWILGRGAGPRSCGGL